MDSLRRLRTVCKVKSRKCGLLVVLAAVTVTVIVLFLDGAQTKFQEQICFLRKYCNVRPYRDSRHTLPNNEHNYTKIKSNDEVFGTLKGFDAATENRSDGGFLLPTRPRAGNQKLYQKDSFQQLNYTWVRDARSPLLKYLNLADFKNFLLLTLKEV